MREPLPQHFVRGHALHLQRQELALRLVHGEYAHPLRFDPLEPQKFPISMLQYHARTPFARWTHYTKLFAFRVQISLCPPSFVHCLAIRKNENGGFRKNENVQKGENNRILQRGYGKRWALDMK